MPALPPVRPEQPSHLTCPSTGLMCTCTGILAFYLMVKHSRHTSARPWGCTRGLWGSCLGLSARLRGCGCHAGHATAPGAIQDMPQLMVAPRPCHSSCWHPGHATAPGAIQAMPELLSLLGHLGATLGPGASAPWAMRQLGLSSHAPRHGQTALKNKWRKEWKFRLLSKRKQQKNPKLTNNYNILTAVLGLLWSCLCFALGRGEWVLQQGPHRKSGSPEGHPQLSLCPCFAQPQLLQAPTTLLPSGLWQDHPLQGITCIFYILIKTAEF